MSVDMEILSESSSYKTFESLSLSETVDGEESISEVIDFSRTRPSAHKTSTSGNTVSSRGEKDNSSISTLESNTTDALSESYGPSSGTPVATKTSSTSSAASLDSNNAGEESVDTRMLFLERCIKAAHQSSRKQSKPATESSVAMPFEAEFCRSCIEAIKSESQTKEVKPERHAEPTITVNPLIIEKLKFERLMHAMREVTTKQEVTGDIQNCKVCRNWKSRIDETTFLRESIRYLKKQLTEWRLQEHLISMDSVNQIGDLASGLPKVSDPPQDIWEKLLKK